MEISCELLSVTASALTSKVEGRVPQQKWANALADYSSCNKLSNVSLTHVYWTLQVPRSESCYIRYVDKKE